MMARLIFTIISTLLEEAALAVVVIWGLPRIGVSIPLAGLIGLMVAWLAYSIFTYRIGSRAFQRKPIVGLPDMVGSQGEVVSPLVPEGLVRIKGELWLARAINGKLEVGKEVMVVKQDSLKLIVRARHPTDNLTKTT